MKQKILLSLLLLITSVSFVTMAQEAKVSGKVVDEGGSGLPGVSVIEKGTGKGTITDVEGSYTLSLDNNSILLFSYIGFETQEVSVGSQSIINISLTTDITTLSEVVVVGYGTQRKENITGSVVSVSGDKIRAMPVPSFEAALQGQAAGVQVIQSSGLSGSGSVIRIRGVASISASSDPLYVVDGIPITSDPFLRGNSGAMNVNPLANINPNDIESIEILKDATATGIYGSRGANGVILITTKRGEAGKPKFTFSSRVGVSEPTNKANMLNSTEYLQLLQEAWENDGNTGVPTDAAALAGMTWDEAQAQAATGGTDWWDQVVRTGIKQQYDISMSQGSDKLTIYAGLGYSDNQSYLDGNSYERLSGRVNVDYDVLDNLKVSATTSLSRSVNNRVQAAWEGGLGRAMSQVLPIMPINNSDGSFYYPGTETWRNPLFVAENTDWQSVDIRTINTLKATYTPIENLNITATGSIDYLTIDDSRVTGRDLDVSQLVEDRNEFEDLNLVTVKNYSASLVTDYSMTINEDHKLKFLLGSEFQTSVTESSYEKYTDNVLDEAASRSNPLNEWLFLGVFNRVNYSYKDRYLLEVVSRMDGSSRFGPDKRFGFFPSASAGWIISREDFLAKSDVISFLKLKTSYGLTGNSNFDNNAWRGVYLNSAQSGTYNGQQIIAPRNFENPSLQWEVSKNFNLSIEAGFLKDRISTELTYYNRNTEEVLLNVSVPKSTGFNRTWINVGSVVNKGYEMSLKSRNLIGALKWTTDFNISYNNNELASLGVFATDFPDLIGGGTNDTRLVVGQPIGVNYLVRYAGVDPDTGQPIYLDKDGNITYTWSPDDRVITGDVIPDFTGGITNTLVYKDFEFSFLFTFVKGGDIYDSSSKRQLGLFSEGWNQRTDVFDRWRQPGDNATYPKLTLDPGQNGSGTPWINTDLWLHDGSFVRLRNVAFSYNIPDGIVDKMKLKSARVSVSASNLLTFTNFQGLDPEIARDFENVQDRNLSPNVTYLTPPQERTFNLSINVTF